MIVLHDFWIPCFNVGIYLAFESLAMLFFFQILIEFLKYQTKKKPAEPMAQNLKKIQLFRHAQKEIRCC